MLKFKKIDNTKKFNKDSWYLIKNINLGDYELAKLASIGFKQGEKIQFYKQSIFKYPIAFFISNRIVMIEKKIILNTEFEEITGSQINESSSKSNKKT